ncbi:protoheme IX farnesyltransferase [Sinobacterium caligoides]|uniref:Protoheme IX farnesyltransferase n=1 Tax=Sinobacterium caligoides TaxID=933926 RepID=A0A3N2DGP9_9GAMM|nr:heme o synthase [Sinobacterium caligoides]ROR98973.1 protoheme IX farnesyltransferase [Sinobacterium caligoides]
MNKQVAVKPSAAENITADYIELCKPKVVLLLVLTSLIGMYMAVPGAVPWQVILCGNLGIGLCAASAAVINHVVDTRIDRLMSRTHKRPVVSGRVGPRQALIFSLLMAVLGMTLLVVWVNPLTALLTFSSLIGYAVVYTMFLKHATPQNIVIGGLAGAAPPLLGWVAVTGRVDGHGLLLMLIIFAWTPPHFWALAIARYDDYARADVPMLPVTHGIPYTRLSVLLYTVILFVVSLLPFVTAMSGPLYLAAAVILGILFLYYALQVFLGDDKKWPMATFRYSITYLTLLFILMLVDHQLFPMATAGLSR